MNTLKGTLLNMASMWQKVAGSPLLLTLVIVIFVCDSIAHADDNFKKEKLLGIKSSAEFDTTGAPQQLGGLGLLFKFILIAINWRIGLCVWATFLLLSTPILPLKSIVGNILIIPFLRRPK